MALIQGSHCSDFLPTADGLDLGILLLVMDGDVKCVVKLCFFAWIWAVLDLPLSRTLGQAEFPGALVSKSKCLAYKPHGMGSRGLLKILVGSMGKASSGDPGGKAFGSCKILWHLFNIITC